MDKIGIDILCPEQYNSKNTKNKLDVNSLYQTTNSNYAENFSVDSLLEVKKKKKRLIKTKYKEIYNACLMKIEESNKFGKVDIIYMIPIAIYGCNDYNIEECVKYVEKNLRKLHMDTLRLEIDKLFISWHNIEENRKNHEDNNKDSKDSKDSKEKKSR